MALARYHPTFKQCKGKLGGLVFEDSWGLSIFHAIGRPRYKLGYRPEPLRGSVGPTKWAFCSVQSRYRSLSPTKLALWSALAVSIGYLWYDDDGTPATPQNLYTQLTMPRQLYYEEHPLLSLPPCQPVYIPTPNIIESSLSAAPDGTLNYAATIDSIFAPRDAVLGDIIVVKFSRPSTPYSESTPTTFPYFTTFAIGSIADQPISCFSNLPFFKDVPSNSYIHYQVFSTFTAGRLSSRGSGRLIVP